MTHILKQAKSGDWFKLATLLFSAPSATMEDRLNVEDLLNTVGSAETMEQLNGQGLNIRERIRHNILPSETERAAILESVITAESRLSEIRAAAPGSTGVIEEEIQLRRYISDCSSLFAPIRLRSDDLLETIFLLNIHGIVNFNYDTRFLVVDPRNPNALAAVSRHWRSAALDTPWLWSSFHVTGSRCQYTLRRLQLHLERSEDAALTIILDLSSGLPLNLEILDEIMKHAERWIGFRISTPHYQYLNLFASVCDRLHWLEEISFELTPGTAQIDPTSDMNALKEAPKLRTVRFRYLRDIGCIPVIRFHQTGTVGFTWSDPPLCGDILPVMFPNAENLIFSPVFAFLSFHNPSHPVPKLHRTARKIAIFGGDSKEYDMMILHRLTTPNLRKLHVIDCAVWDAPSITSFFARSACPLQTLVLRNTRMRAGELLALLRAGPSIQVLILADLLSNSIINLVITALAPLPGSDVALPVLARIVLTGMYLFSTDALLRMLEGRSPSLADVDLAFPAREMGPADRARFTALQASTKYLALQCLDEEKRRVRIESERIPCSTYTCRPNEYFVTNVDYSLEDGTNILSRLLS
ncbi:hypothetical protein B0H17DRAFT_1135146 [Mycena rosella]|uniref:F-box domain-containing protein n=1 Tax=Mycena rosella TaxID=1033263 RepID=A0AAD7GDJ0_MYCRO|nr:hypothetical protein B0H17DRAFT_1135146 [Mycena rosella]